MVLFLHYVARGFFSSVSYSSEEGACYQIDFRALAYRCLTLFDMGGGGMMAPQNVLAYFAQTVRRTKLKLGDF